ncbi:MAG: tetratricopeptide repeat protein [Bryobacterales bacterium]|nr:tetratricopeptide repeat protein [Bryobacterales bacterium]
MGAKALDSRDYPAAVRHFHDALRANPSDPAILSSLGVALAALQRFAEAAEQFRALIKLQPRVAAHHFNLGLALLNSNGNDAAEQAFRMALRIEPQHARARVQLANALLAQARGGDTSKMQAAAAAYRDALPANPNDPELRFNYAFTLARTGDEEGALREYKEVVRLAPNVPQAHFFLGITQFQAGNWNEALVSLSKAADKGISDFHLHYYLGSALLRVQDYSSARTHLERAAATDAAHPGVHFQLAALFRALGDKQRVATEQQLFRQLTAEQESRWRAQSLELAAGRALKAGDLKQGISALEQAFEAKPDAALARNLALAYLQAGDSEKAKLLLDRALALAPDDAGTLNYLGLLAARRSDMVQAMRYFDRATETDPAFVDARFNAGVAAFELKRYSEAIKRFTDALAVSDNPRIREALAMALADAGRNQEAQSQFEAGQRQRARTGAR